MAIGGKCLGWFCHGLRRDPSGVFFGVCLLVLFICLSSVLPVHAASFDCAKAATKAEKLICDNPKISKLDDELGKAYQAVLSKANDEQRQRLIAEQEHWLTHTRNVCGDETCFKHAYWSRQAGLDTFFAPHSPLYNKESDKADAIKQVLATAPLYYSAGTDSVVNQFCSQMFEDLKQLKGISFVDPIVQTQSYEDPALDPWKKQCKQPLNFDYGCEPRLYPGDNNIEEIIEICDVGYGLPPFKLFELPPLQSSGQTRYVFYSDVAYGPINKDWKKPMMGGGGFQKIDFPSCKLLPTYTPASGGARSGPNYNSIIEYKNQYYFLTLRHHESPSYWLSITSVERKKSCDWTPVKPAAKQGGK